MAATLMWLVALGLMNSVVSCCWCARVLKAMFLREAGTRRLAAPDRGISIPIVMGTVVVVIFGLMPVRLASVMQAAAVPMLTSSPAPPVVDPVTSKARPATFKAQSAAPSHLHSGTFLREIEEPGEGSRRAKRLREARRSRKVARSGERQGRPSER